MGYFCFVSRGQAQPVPPPFRPLNRSLGLLPSIALSRPVQVGSLLTVPLARSTKKQRTASTPLTSCLTFGRIAEFRPPPSITRPGKSGQITCELDRTDHILPTQTGRRPLISPRARDMIHPQRFSTPTSGIHGSGHLIQDCPRWGASVSKTCVYGRIAQTLAGDGVPRHSGFRGVVVLPGTTRRS
jgi:hypothetical protein